MFSFKYTMFFLMLFQVASIEVIENKQEFSNVYHDENLDELVRIAMENWGDQGPKETNIGRVDLRFYKDRKFCALVVPKYYLDNGIECKKKNVQHKLDFEKWKNCLKKLDDKTEINILGNVYSIIPCENRYFIRAFK